MVGVPGRSKACITCRKRKKRCDLEKPSCRLCAKIGLTCEGYDLRRIFVTSTPSTRQIGYRAPMNTQTSVNQAWHLIYRNQVPGVDTNFRLLTRPETERRCINVFWEIYYPSGRPIPSRAIRSYTCTWTETARTLFNEDETLRCALWAVCLYMTGTRDNVVWMVQEGAKLYGDALSSMRKSLLHSEKKATLLASMKLLSMFETFSQHGKVINPISGQCLGLKAHHAGELALFVASSPEEHIDGDLHHIFADERVELALSALLQRKHLVLSGSEWKSIPWQKIPKDLKDILVDTLVEMPGLVEDFDSMLTCDNEAVKGQRRLIIQSNCLEHDRNLSIWLGSLRQIMDHSEYSSTELKSQDVVTYVARVHGTTLYLVTCLVLYGVLQAVTEPPNALPKRMNPLHFARSLVDGLAVLVGPKSGLYGRQSATLLLEVASQYVRALACEVEESEQLLGAITRLKSGWEMGFTGAMDSSIPIIT